MTKFKKMMSVTLAGCMAASALMMSAGATRRDGKADDTELSSAAMIVSSVPQSDEEILAEYNEYQKNGAFSLDEDTTDTYSTVTENDESAPYIVSSEPISDEEIEQNMKKYSQNLLVDVQARGNSIPTSVYDLGKETYTGTFNFKNYTYTNYCFLNPYGYLNVEVSATTGNKKDTSYTVALYKC